MLKNILIFTTGLAGRAIFRLLNEDNYCIKGFIENNNSLHG